MLRIIHIEAVIEGDFRLGSRIQRNRHHHAQVIFDKGSFFKDLGVKIQYRRIERNINESTSIKIRVNRNAIGQQLARQHKVVSNVYGCRRNKGSLDRRRCIHRREIYILVGIEQQGSIVVFVGLFFINALFVFFFIGHINIRH